MNDIDILGPKHTQIAKVITKKNKSAATALAQTTKKSYFVQISVTNLMFNSKQCNVLICRDISKIRENEQLSANNKMLTVYSSSISHELITPLKCILQICQQVLGRLKNPLDQFDIELVINTTYMLLNQVKGNLDKNLLE